MVEARDNTWKWSHGGSERQYVYIEEGEKKCIVLFEGSKTSLDRPPDGAICKT
jgi:hypothetical protein